MIRMITATPGSGKTCIVIEWLLREIDKGFYKSYYSNINGLKICGIRPLLDDWREVPEDKKPALIIVDEAQYHTEFMKETKTTNDIGKALSTHRHYGTDFWLITQSPKLLNSYVIENVGEHVHLFRPRKKKTVTVYWWSYAVTNMSKSNFKDADDVQKWRLNPHMFDYYKSTVAVTDSQSRISQRNVTVYITCAIIFCVIGVYVKNGLASFEKMQHSEETTVTGADRNQMPDKKVEKEKEKLDSTSPEEDKKLALSDERSRIASVFESSNGCRAYNSFGDLLDISVEKCKDYSKNPYKLTATSEDIRQQRLQAVNYRSSERVSTSELTQTASKTSSL